MKIVTIKVYELSGFETLKIGHIRTYGHIRTHTTHTPILGCRTDFFFFFLEKKVDHSLFWGEIYRSLP